MDRRDDAEFRAWLTEGGIGEDPRYPESDFLIYTAVPELSRFWLPRDVPSDLPNFLLTAVRAASGNGSCWLYLRGGGAWFAGPDGSSREAVMDRMLIGSGIGPKASGALRFGDDEWQPMLVILIAYYTLGWHVGNDVYVVPDDRSHLLMLGHHGELRCHCATQERLDAFIAAMAANEFFLPDHVPDSTFKVPEWMREDEGTT